MKIGAVDRDRTHGDPAFLDVPVARLTSKDYAAEMAARIKRGEKTHVPRMASKEAADTTQVCVVDRAGLCVSLTHTLGNRTHAATILGISIRALRNRLREYAREGAAVPPPGTGYPAHAA